MARASGGTMEHLEFFELPADPFQNDADARFYYESAPQKRARLRLLRGIHQRKALSVLVGGPGLGKTTLAHMLLRELEGKDYVAHYLSIPHEACSSAWFLPNVARAFGVPMPSPQVGQLVDQIHTQLVAIVTSRRAPVLLIDEAQLFRNREAMEEFRGMLNLLHGGKKLLSMVLFGLPELDDVLKLDEPLAQRVEIRVEMTAMDWLESQAYVSHRLRLPGATSAVFAPDALEALFRWSGGVPRVLNTLADNALFEGFLTETKPVDSPVVQAAAQSLGLVRVPSDTMPSIPPPALAAPDLLASTQVKLPPHPARAARPEPGLATMPVAKLSPRPRAPEPEPEEDLAEELELAPTAEPDVEPAAAESDPSPDWLEPLSPMPEAATPTRHVRSKSARAISAAWHWISKLICHCSSSMTHHKFISGKHRRS
jgi:type II secretory pathway predicted ATPase ExeA